MKNSDDEDFLILNPDTLWNSNYVNTFNEMEKYYFKYKIKNLLMVVKKIKVLILDLKEILVLKNKLTKKVKNDLFIQAVKY